MRNKALAAALVLVLAVFVGLHWRNRPEPIFDGIPSPPPTTVPAPTPTPPPPVPVPLPRRAPRWGVCSQAVIPVTGHERLPLHAAPAYSQDEDRALAAVLQSTVTDDPQFGLEQWRMEAAECAAYREHYPRGRP